MTTVTAPGSRRLPLSIAVPTLEGPALGAALLFMLCFAIGLIHFTDPDYFWHFETGRYIVDTGSIPKHDPFSFTAAGQRWVTHEWLSETLMYSLQSAIGYGANTILFIGLATLALFVSYKTALSFGIARWIAVGLLAWSAMLILPFWTVRPLVFTWLLFAVFVAVLHQHHAGTSNRLWLLPPLMALWANLHAAYVMGLALVGLYVVSLVIERYLMHEKRDLKTPALVLGACLLATALNPNTVQLWIYPLTYVTPGNASMDLITEWQSPDFHAPYFWVLAFAIIALAAVGVSSRRRDVFLPLLMLAMTFLSLQSVRHQPLFALSFLVVMAALLSDRWEWARAGYRTATHQTHSAINWALLVVMLVGAIVVASRSPDLQLGSMPRVEGRVDYPVAGAQYIGDNYPDARVFNEFMWGGYLMHELRPRKVFIDGRPDMYGDAFVKQYADTVRLEDGWQDTFDKYDIDVILIDKDGALADRLDITPGWRRVFTGDAETIFARNP